MDLKDRTVSGVKWTTISTLTKTGFQVLQLVILARLLAPEDFGLMAMVMVVIGFAQAYADAGISAAIIHRQDTTPHQLSSLYWLNIFSGGLVFLIMWLLTPAIVLLYNEPRLTSLLQMVSLTFLILPLGKQFEILLQKELCFNLLAKQEIIAVVVATIVAVVSAVLGQGVWSLVWSQLSQEGLRAIMLMIIGLRQYRPMFHFSLNDLRGYLSFGLYQMGERSINFLAERIDQLLIGSLLGAQPLGYYNFAFNLVIQPINRINPIMTRVAFPVFAKVQDDMERLQRGYFKMLNLLNTINAPALIGLAVLAPQAIPLIFGEQWSDSIILVQILALVALLRSVGNPTGSLLLAKGRADLGFKWNWFLFAVSIPTIYIGAKIGETFGIALVLLTLQLVLKVPGYLYLLRPLIGRSAYIYAKTIIKPIAIAGLMGIGVWLIGLASQNSWLTLWLQVSIGIMLYLFLLWIVDKDQVIELVQLILGAHHPITKKIIIRNSV